MTTKQTLQHLKKAGKPVSLTHLYRIFAVVGIRPQGRSRPQEYPADTAERVKAHFGLVPFGAQHSAARTAARVPSLITPKQLLKFKPSTKVKK